MENKRYKLVRDQSHKFFSVSPMPSGIELEQFYERQYYQNQNGNYRHQYSLEELKYLEEDAEIIESFFDIFSSNEKRRSVLDVGCGEGFQSAYFLKKDWEVKCIDFSEYGLSHHNPQLMSHFTQGDIQNLVESDTESYSVILLKNVLEHVVNPKILLKNLRNLMDDQSLLFIEVPNDHSDFQSMIGSKDYRDEPWFCPPQHLHYFQFKSLISLLNDLGFEVISSQAGYPVETFLLVEETNYYANPAIGKKVHEARVTLSNHLRHTNLVSYINFRESMAALGFGRDIKIIAKRATFK